MKYFLKKIDGYFINYLYFWLLKKGLKKEY